ncbi:hypothetical protein JOD43_000843 [Pullulanibacillus pueri]|uniref:Uncharacterized protein n=1 Tax=Pullulanibacillus pueri TaxID=1437324 RepID=A0A8J3EMJ4_9BACL|nr:SE1832 family protein [Pullulanibacillus pueri]MBM7680681.1 hypothetical protein [Pullulanibacillus pueri]GGH83760.1 hypothetical protein GCM10007096_25260 [Pullulanibacillus pueri]
MTKKEIEDLLIDLKSDYVRVQGDLEKMEATVGNSASAEKELVRIEEEMKKLRAQLSQM